MTNLAVADGALAATNHFDSLEAAWRYASDRPRGHARVLALMRSVLGDALPVERALDVGCGTGHSTVALLPFARRIVGLDPSSAMLGEAPRHPHIEYRKGYAEAIPLRSGEFDLVTVSSAYHWFDHARFLGEAARLLRRGGWLVLYKAGSTGRIADCPAFETWLREVFKARYPKVARNHEPLTAADATAHGFTEHAHETGSSSARHSLDRYVDNLLTHSRVIRGVNEHGETYAAARAWLLAELAPYFPDGEADLVHQNRIHVLRRE